MRDGRRGILTYLVVSIALMNLVLAAPRRMEHLGRGLVAVRQPEGPVFLSWRLLATDPEDAAFNVYRSTGADIPVRLNPAPLVSSTCFVDMTAPADQLNTYYVTVLTGAREAHGGAPFVLTAGTPARQYFSIPLRTPAGYSPNDGSVGDLDGDGEYEIVLHQTKDGRDNSQDGITGEPILEAYRLDGAFLWRINLGKNIREGAHYTQFIVFDLDSDGKAEIACKTADGTTDGVGTVIGDPNADYRNAAGRILTGPEFLTVFEGATGRALVTTDYLPPRGNLMSWGDDWGNRGDRFLACVAYLDGENPSLVMCRGYYERTTLVAWNWRNGELSRLWTFDTSDGTPGILAYARQGNHGISVADVDADGKDEIIYGACTIDDNGAGLYSTGLGHGDALHLSDLDPSRPGLEVFSIHEHPQHPYGASFYDARAGQLIWGKQSSDPGRGLAADIDPRYPGAECWASGAGLNALYSSNGLVISSAKPSSCNFAVWWDGDLLRELLDSNRIAKWNWETGIDTTLLFAGGCASNNGTKSTPVLSADLFGDWREEVIWRTADNLELRIYTTIIPTDHRFYTLMHDPVYRMAIAWQNVAYNQPPHTGFHLGEGMAPPPRPEITTGVREWKEPRRPPGSRRVR